MEKLQRDAALLGHPLQLILGSEEVAADVASPKFEITPPDSPDAVLFDHLDGSGGADKVTGAAADADHGGLDKRSTHLLMRTAVGKADGAYADGFFTGLDAESAEDALPVSLIQPETRLLHAHPGGYPLDDFGVRAAS